LSLPNSFLPRISRIRADWYFNDATPWIYSRDSHPDLWLHAVLSVPDRKSICISSLQIRANPRDPRQN
jgi:hypothetical protein